jgi:hypothetical protein
VSILERKVDMLKVMCTLKKNPNMTQEEFESFYNMKHAPFSKNIMGDNVLRYVRNFRRSDSPFLVGNPLDLDCITEFHFENEDKMRRALAAVADERFTPQLRAEEAEFLDLANLRISMVEVREDTDGRP